MVTKSKTTLTPVRAASLVRMMRCSSNSASSPVDDVVGAVLLGETEALLLGVGDEDLDLLGAGGDEEVLDEFEEPEAESAGADDEDVTVSLAALESLHDGPGLDDGGESPGGAGGKDGGDVHGDGLGNLDQVVQGGYGHEVRVSGGGHLVGGPDDDLVADGQIMAAGVLDVVAECLEDAGDFVAGEEAGVLDAGADAGLLRVLHLAVRQTDAGVADFDPRPLGRHLRDGDVVEEVNLLDVLWRAQTQSTHRRHCALYVCNLTPTLTYVRLGTKGRRKGKDSSATRSLASLCQLSVTRGIVGASGQYLHPPFPPLQRLPPPPAQKVLLHSILCS